MWPVGPTLLLTLVAPLPDGMREVGPAELTLAYPAPGESGVSRVGRFLLDERPVTNEEMLEFVTAVPRWQRGRAEPMLADEHYLEHWQGPLELGPTDGDNLARQPVTRVSWFAAKAYCAWRGKRLPAQREWELAAAADETRKDAAADPEFQRRILDWYATKRPSILPAAGSGVPNAWGIRDLHGLVWEWVQDFNRTLISTDNREAGSANTAQFCGAGAIGAQDPGDYGTFMRYAFRSSLQARFTTSNLGFRCAADPSRLISAPSYRVAGLELELEDQDRRRVTAADLRHDGPLVVSMFYATCAYACPTLIRDLVAIDRELTPQTRQRTRYLLVTFDPDHDTPEVLAKLRSAHHVPSDRWTFARAADDDATRELAATLGITYLRLPDGNYNHTSVIVGLDRDGRPRAKIDGLKRDASAFVRALEKM